MWERRGLTEVFGLQAGTMRWSGLAVGRAGFESASIPLRVSMDLRFRSFPAELQNPELSRLKLLVDVGAISLGNFVLSFKSVLGQEGVRYGVLEETRPWYMGWVEVSNFQDNPLPRGVSLRLGGLSMKDMIASNEIGGLAMGLFTWQHVFRKPWPLGLVLKAGFGKLRFWDEDVLYFQDLRLRMDPSLKPEWVGPHLGFTLTRPLAGRASLSLRGWWEHVHGLLGARVPGWAFFAGQSVALPGANGTLVMSNGRDSNVMGMGITGRLRRGIFEAELNYEYESVEQGLASSGYRPAHSGGLEVSVQAGKWDMQAGLSFLGPRAQDFRGTRVSAAGFSRVGVGYDFSRHLELSSVLHNPLGTDGPYQLDYPQKKQDFHLSLTGRF